ncbi:MAG: cation:proton antiporter [Solirubrobacteraceae bacterium]
MEWALAIVAATILAVAACSRLLSDTPVTPAMVFVAVGLIAGPLVLDDIDPSTSGSAVRALAEATLALVLFSDAARIELRKLRKERLLPERLLGIGLPLTIAGGGLIGLAIFPSLTVTEALVLAIILAPTDAALGQAVVTNPRVPGRIRQALNVEGGLNDGICVPLLLIVLATAEAESHTTGSGEAARIVIEEIGYGLLAGVGVGALVAAVIIHAGRRKLIAEPWLQTVTVAGAFLAYGMAAGLGGSGFIGAFVAGMSFGHIVRRDTQPLTVFTEDLGQLLNGVTFIMFGAVLLGPVLENLDWSAVLYGLLSLTLVRMIPVGLGLIGAHARPQSVAFLGWFGPRGLASIVFAVIVVEDSHLPHVATILSATYVTIGLSILLHGLTAAPLADRYARWFAGHPDDRRPAMESSSTATHRVRGPARASTVA